MISRSSLNMKKLKPISYMTEKKKKKMSKNPVLNSTVITVILFSVHCVTFCNAVGKTSPPSSSSSPLPSQRGVGGVGKGSWRLLLNSTGVVAMHMALTHRNTVVMFDQTGGVSSYRLHVRYNGSHCGHFRSDLADGSCYAHSVEYNVLGKEIRPLRLDTDPWCSSGSFLSSGTLLQTGGYRGGSRRIRYFRPCSNGQCDWKQSSTMLSDDRWYSSSQRLSSHQDRVIVVGGRSRFTYEFVPKLQSMDKPFNLPFLHQTTDDDGENNLYPFLHLAPDGNLFIFTNRDSILLNPRRNKVVKTYPRMPGNGSRNYPSSGSSVILPLHHEDGYRKMEVMVCGGSASGAYRAVERRNFLPALRSCGRMVITGNKHKWDMEAMPGPRVMNDMLILPSTDILIINGAKRGTAGWNNARSAALEPYLYKSNKLLGRRFSVLKSTKIPRMYHSAAIVLTDGSVLVGGSNPNNGYAFRNVAFPTELRLQAFLPAYLDQKNNESRPSNISITVRNKTLDGIRYREDFTVRFWLRKQPTKVLFNAYVPPFTTHSVSMNQRMLVLNYKNMVQDQDGWVTAVLEAPPSSTVAPSGYYMFNIVNSGIPGESQWIRFIQT